MAAIPATVIAQDAARSTAGTAPGQNPLSIGGYVFPTTSAPRQLEIGSGEQSIVQSKLIGGGLVTATMGSYPDPLTWRGTFRPTTMDVDVAAMTRLRDSGREQLISWKALSFYGIVHKFTPTYRSGGQACDWILEITITRPVDGSFGNPSQASVDQHNADLLDTANVSGAAIAAADTSSPALPLLGPQIANAQLAVTGASPAANAAPTATASALGSVGTALATARTVLASISSTSASFIPARQLVAALTLLQANLQSGQSQRTSALQGGSLYALAAQGGDVTRVFPLMGANGLSSPTLTATAVTTIVQPPLRKAS